MVRGKNRQRIPFFHIHLIALPFGRFARTLGSYLNFAFEDEVCGAGEGNAGEAGFAGFFKANL